MAAMKEIESKAIELNGYLKGVNEATKAFLQIIEGVKIESNVGADNADELHDKCKTCIHKTKYQDDTPCCDCDPKNGAEMYEPELEEDESTESGSDLILYQYDVVSEKLQLARLDEFSEGEFVFDSHFHVIGFKRSGKLMKWNQSETYKEWNAVRKDMNI